MGKHWAYWQDQANVTKLLELTARGFSYGEIADAMAIPRGSVVGKLQSMGMKATVEPKGDPCVKPDAPQTCSAWRMEGVRFEDHPRGDSDRHKGRKPPKPHRGYSLTGNSSALCAL